jgi:hypothetical protein
VSISAFHGSNPAWARDPSLARPEHYKPAQPVLASGGLERIPARPDPPDPAQPGRGEAAGPAGASRPAGPAGASRPAGPAGAPRPSRGRSRDGGPRRGWTQPGVGPASSAGRTGHCELAQPTSMPARQPEESAQQGGRPGLIIFRPGQRLCRPGHEYAGPREA